MLLLNKESVYGLPYAFGVLALMFSLLSISSAAEPAWSTPDLLRVIRAREESIRSLDVTFELTEGIDRKAYQKQYYARARSAKAIAQAMGQTFPPVPPPPLEEMKWPEKMRIRFLRDSKGRERYERIAMVKEHWTTTDLHVFNGQIWVSNVGDRSSLHDAKGVPNFGRFLGLGFDWSEPTASKAPRSLYRLLEESEKSGYLDLPKRQQPAHLVALMLRKPAPMKEMGDRFVQHSFLFDENQGLALVKGDTRHVQKKAGQYGETLSGYTECRWADFREVFSGLSLPYEYSEATFAQILLPKEGDTFSFRIDPSNPHPSFPLSEVKFESFLAAEKKAKVLSFIANKELDPSLFEVKAPPGTVVYDSVRDKQYQVGEGLPRDIDLANMPLTDTPQRLAWVIYLNVLLVIALLLIFAYRLLKSRASRANRKTGL